MVRALSACLLAFGIKLLNLLGTICVSSLTTLYTIQSTGMIGERKMNKWLEWLKNGLKIKLAQYAQHFSSCLDIISSQSQDTNDK